MQLGINGEEEILLELMSLEGKVLKTQKVKGSGAVSTRFDIEHLATSMYMLRITTKSGTVTKNIVKK